MDVLPEATRAALAPVLGPCEQVTRFVPAIGCSLVLTERRLVLVRELSEPVIREAILGLLESGDFKEAFEFIGPRPPDEEQ